jgi:hypothetical protein
VKEGVIRRECLFAETLVPAASNERQKEVTNEIDQQHGQRSDSATPHPTAAEAQQFSIKAYRGIEVGLGRDEPLASIAMALERQYPHHQVLVQRIRERIVDGCCATGT